MAKIQEVTPLADVYQKATDFLVGARRTNPGASPATYGDILIDGDSLEKGLPASGRSTPSLNARSLTSNSGTMDWSTSTNVNSLFDEAMASAGPIDFWSAANSRYEIPAGVDYVMVGVSLRGSDLDLVRLHHFDNASPQTEEIYTIGQDGDATTAISHGYGAVIIAAVQEGDYFELMVRSKDTSGTILNDAQFWIIDLTGLLPPTAGDGVSAKALFSRTTTFAMDGDTVIEFGTTVYNETGITESSGEFTIPASLNGKRIKITAFSRPDSNFAASSNQFLAIEKDVGGSPVSWSSTYDGVGLTHSAQDDATPGIKAQTAWITVATGDKFRVREQSDDVSYNLSASVWVSFEVEADRSAFTIREATTASDTLSLQDANNAVLANYTGSPAGQTINIPLNSSVAFPIGTVINITAKTSQTVTIDAATGVTMNGVSGGSGDLSGQYEGVSLMMVAADEWIAQGSIGTIS